MKIPAIRIQEMPFGTYFKFKGALWHKLPDGTGYRRIGSSSPDGLNIPHPLYDEGEPVDMESPIKRAAVDQAKPSADKALVELCDVMFKIPPFKAKSERQVLNSNVQASNAHKVVLPQFVTLTITKSDPVIEHLLEALQATGKVTVSKLE